MIIQTAQRAQHSHDTNNHAYRVRPQRIGSPGTSVCVTAQNLGRFLWSSFLAPVRLIGALNSGCNIYRHGCLRGVPAPSSGRRAAGVCRYDDGSWFGASTVPRVSKCTEWAGK
jgi:hypothetical protein